MKIRRQLLVSAIITLLLVLASWAATEVASESVADFCRRLLLPGFVADAYLSGNVHSGFGGVTGALVGTLGATIFWLLPLWFAVELLALPFRRKKEPIQPPQTTTGSEAPGRV